MKHRHLYLIRNFERCQEIRKAEAEWLNSLPWDWFFTGTFDDRYLDIGKMGAKHIFYSFLNKIFEQEKVIPFFWMGLEIQGYRSIPHIHALIKFNWQKEEKEIRRDKWWEYWFKRYGRNRIEPYNRELGAGYYLGKYIYKPEKLIDWDFCMTVEDWYDIRIDYLRYKDEIKKRFDKGFSR